MTVLLLGSGIGGLFVPSDAAAGDADESTVHRHELSPPAVVTSAESGIPRVSIQLAQETPSASDPSPALKSVVGRTQDQVAVLYPDLDEPYRSIFFTIIKGIEETVRAQVFTYPVGDKANTEDISRELSRRGTRVVIALGRQGLNTASLLDRHLSVIAGGIIWAPEVETPAISVVSLAPDPTLLFARLKSLKPSVKRVFVVYDPRQNAWLIRLAQEASKAHGMELVALKAEALKPALQHYQEVFANADSKQDALWLPQDSTTVDDAAVLPLVLDQSWRRSLAVFSSSVIHVRRGVLFALYPDNAGLGRQLADTALDILGSDRPAAGTVMPLKNVLIAVNIRTGNHLGIRLGYLQQQAFDLIFPQP
jgi:putative ABC transport system substrate-binding protein